MRTWQRRESSIGELRWQAPCRKNKSSAVAVEATARRRGGYTMKVSVRHNTSWRRGQPDVVVDVLESSQARQVFDQALQIAFAR
jgi:hypothetical protein